MTTGRLPLGPLARKHCIDCGVALGRTRIQKKCNKCFIAMGPNKISKLKASIQCANCGVGLAYKAIDNLCSNCFNVLSLSKQNEKGVEDKRESLKVLQIQVWEAGSSHHRGTRAKKMPGLIDVIVMLNTDMDAAMDQVSRDYDPQIYDIEVIELLGPFKAGFVLSNWTD